MAPSSMTVLITLLAAGISLAAVAYVFLGQAAVARTRTNKRIQAIAKPEKDRKGRLGAGQTGRDKKKAVQDTLKDIEEKQKAEKKQRVSLRMLIQQAGFEFSVQVFWIASVVCGISLSLFMVLIGQSLIAIVAALVIGALGLPRWFLNFTRNRRRKKFTEEFANALDVIVRGVKSGLPLNECLKIISTEAQEPVRSEFTMVTDAQKIGLPLDQCLHQLYERVGVPEVNFFMIVLIIQQGSGGNLSEALGNLSDVLRTRKQMRAKIQAMSSEAKASALIIGSLPPGVAGLVYLTSPGYMIDLFTTQTGHIMMMGSAVWMSIGIIIMRKMINFNF